MKRDFKGVWIPADLWLDESLTKMEMLFLVEIDSLSTLEKGCIASNKHFAEFFRLSVGRCSQIVASLQEKGYISTELIYDESGKNVIQRRIGVFRKLNRGIKNTKDPYLENAQEKNTKIINTIKTIAHPAGAPAHFQQFWDSWPKGRKVDRKRCEAFWTKNQLGKKALDTIIPDVLKRTTEDGQWLAGYVPNPLTYLRGERWEDDVAPKRETADSFQQRQAQRRKELEGFNIFADDKPKLR